MDAVIYDQIELAIIARLKDGLGKMVRDVVSYGGEMDENPGRIVSALPAAWVTFGGITRSKPHDTSHQKWRNTGTFVVMVGQQNVRNEKSGRITGRVDEVGTNTLVWSVRRLLMYQDFSDQGLVISPLRPGRVRTLFNTALQNQAFSVFACEFECDWFETVLPITEWPRPEERPEDELFALYHGRIDGRYPLLTQVAATYETELPTEGPVVTDMIRLNEDEL
ncbi:DUF1834 family protein [Oligella urethralis]|uniref:DUF1834 family protein n=1 Tax=Oligella urethralis TaxID=90245 RepID=UPI002889761F|nr:DUF1834 family protein [Oligella urethralis]